MYAALGEASIKNVQNDNQSDNTFGPIRLWRSFLDKVPIVRTILKCFSFSSISLGGFYHNGRSSYTIECSAIIYILLIINLIAYNIEILKPVMENHVMSVSTEQLEHGDFDPPTID